MFSTHDAALAETLRLAERAAISHASILITGETGTGKTRLGRAIHGWSARSSGPFVEVHCPNLPRDLLESELFGHEQGAFTDARVARIGRFEQAHRGTLLLDEIHELDSDLQAKILRVLEERRFERLGGNATIEVDARIVASTRESPEDLLATGRLRSDLFFRLNVVRLRLPPLRERAGDIELLAAEFLETCRRRHGLPDRRFGEEAMERLRHHPWPGNVRELQHVVESSAILATTEIIGVADLPESLSAAGVGFLRAAAAASRSLEEVENAYIDEVLVRSRGNKTAAAKVLGIHRKTLHDKLRARTLRRHTS